MVDVWHATVRQRAHGQEVVYIRRRDCSHAHLLQGKYQTHAGSHPELFGLCPNNSYSVASIYTHAKRINSLQNDF